jgi:hypothetical protein
MIQFWGEGQRVTVSKVWSEQGQRKDVHLEGCIALAGVAHENSTVQMEQLRS